MYQKFLIVMFLMACSFTLVFGQKAPSTLVLSGEYLLKNRQTLADKKIQNSNEAYQALLRRADKTLKTGKLYSVMNKQQIPPSGDKHDYMSQAPYWWADPSKPNGLPYIRRDGERNPELNKISDTNEMDELIEDAETLSLAFFFTGDEKYAVRSAELIRTWFLDPKTRQNPNLNFGQGIPGINQGRGIGIIETRELYRVIDASILLESSKSWSKADQQALRKWFADYLNWLIESPIGKDEADEKNNHGTFYDVQILASAIFAGKNDLARKQIEVSKSRIKDQIKSDGSQPLELARTLSWNYTNMNLHGFFAIARLAENLDIDLWNYETADGKSIKKAFEWILPFAKKEKKWEFQQIKPMSFGQTTQILRLASRKYKKSEYEALVKELSPESYQTAVEGLEF